MKKKTADEFCLESLLGSDNDVNLKALAAAMYARIYSKVECPECGSAGPHDDNGDNLDITFCCAQCGTHLVGSSLPVETVGSAHSGAKTMDLEYGIKMMDLE